LQRPATMKTVIFKTIGLGRYLGSKIIWLFGYFAQTYSDVGRLIGLIKAPLIIVLAFTLLTQTSRQLPELILGYAQLPGATAGVNASVYLLFVLMLLLAGYSFEIIAGAEDESPLDRFWKRRLLISGSIGLTALTPALSIVAAICSARATFRNGDAATLATLSSFRLHYSIVALAAAFAIMCFCYSAFKLHGLIRIQTFRVRRIVLHQIGPIFAAAVWFTTFRSLVSHPETSTGGNTIFFVLLFFIAWTILFCFVYCFFNRRGWPLFLPFFLCYLGLCVRDLNDHHFVSQVEVTVESPSDRDFSFAETLDFSAEAWVRGRDPNRKIYIIAAQGGGIYSAYHAASVIAELIGPEHNLADDIFAISGVSGGSIGTAIALSMAHATQPRDQGANRSSREFCESEWRRHDSLQSAIDEVFRGDFVSPLISGGLFVDTFLEMMPVAWFAKNARFDRAKLLERAFVTRTQQALKNIGSEPSRMLLDEGFLDYQRYTRFHPNLYFNIVSANTGDRSYLAKYELDQFKSNTNDPDQQEKRALPRALTGLNLSLISAAVMSARYPYVTPPASVRTSSPLDSRSVLRFVDGGYFENSGVATALDIARELKNELKKATKNKTPIQLIVLGGKEQQSIGSNRFNELTTPFQAMLQTRVARGEDYIDEAKRDLPDHVSEFRAGPKDVKLTVGWFLSKSTLKLIKDELMARIRRERDLGNAVCARPGIAAVQPK
jgi:hypothetical protein